MSEKNIIKFKAVEKGMIAPTTLYPFGEAGFLINFSGYSDVAIIGIHCHQLAQKLLVHSCWRDIVPAIDSLMVRYDPELISYHDALDALIDVITPAIADILPKPDATIEIPVFYDLEVAPDLMAFCDALECDCAQFIRYHSEKPLRVVAMGFAPGFAYMGSVDPKLQRPRLKSPRPFLAAGSVGLAGAFTGIYSLPSPGGWNIIGRTPLSLFNPEEKNPFILHHNVEVHFRSISKDEYRYLENPQREAT